MKAGTTSEVANRAHLRTLAERINGQRVLIVGDVMLDEYIWGDVRRISPEAPVPVVETQRRTYRPGGAGNVAANIAASGGQAQLCAVAGNDPYADILHTTLANESVLCDKGLLRLPDRPTTIKSRVIAHNQQMLRLDTETNAPIDANAEDALLACCKQILPNSDVLVLSDYAKGVLTARLCRALIEQAREQHVPVVVDPKGRAYERYAGATVVTPNTAELHVAANRLPNSPAALADDAQAVAALLGGAALLVTRGADGMALFGAGNEPFHIAAQARMVYDVTGAGDTVVAVLALALAAGASLPQAAILANIAAGLAVSKVGTATVSREELLAAL